MKYLIDRLRKGTPLLEPGPQPVSNTPDSGVIRLSAPPAEIAAFVIYPDEVPSDFVAMAMVLGQLTLDQAADIKNEVARTGGLPETAAFDRGWLTAEQIDAVLAAQTATISVDGRHAGNPQFLTWIHDLERRGVRVQIELRTAQYLVEAKSQAVTKSELGNDQATLEKVRQLLYDCAAMGASDIHLLIRERHAEVQIRVKGELKTLNTRSMLRDEGEAYARALYTGLATVKEATYNPLQFQNGQIQGNALPGSGLSSVRIIRGPAFPVEQHGGFMVARLQYGRHTGTIDRSVSTRRPLALATPESPPGELRLVEMGFTPLQLELVEKLVRMPMGLTIVTGPTGSGKTTTLFEMLMHHARLFPDNRQITIEDPPEYPMSWAVQLAVKGEQFQEMVRMALRMDPDVIFVGELRSAGEAVAALQAGLTGHLVFSTLHVTDPYKAFARLEMLDHPQLARGMTCDPEQIIGLTAQRLVSKLCSHCSRPLLDNPDALPRYMLDALKTWGDLDAVRVRGDGCGHCQGDAITGKAAVAEIVVCNEVLMDDMLTHGAHVARRNHRMRPGSDKSMLGNVMDLVLAGKVDPRDAHKEVHQIVNKADGV